MRPAAGQLADFYASRVGRRVAAAVRARLAVSLRNRAGDRLLGVGYCPPFLDGLTDGAERCLLVMPPRQGVRRWPSAAPNRVVMAAEKRLPFPDAMFDQLVVAHALEFSEPTRQLREYWRVLAPGGSLLLIVPNRAGLWTHFETTPFGAGQPYGRRQLQQVLEASMFEVVRWRTALVMPPRRLLMPLEPAAAWLLPELGGLLVFEALKVAGPGAQAVGAAQPALLPAGIAAMMQVAQPR